MLFPLSFAGIHFIIDLLLIFIYTQNDSNVWLCQNPGCLIKNSKHPNTFCLCIAIFCLAIPATPL